MSYPWVPDSWVEPVSQNLYASLILIVVQSIAVMVWRGLAWGYRNRGAPKFVTLFGWLTLALVPLTLLAIGLREENVSRIQFAAFALSLTPLLLVLNHRQRSFAYKAAEVLAKTDRLRHLGFHDAVVQPHVEDYKRFLEASVSDFALLGIGAEKLTRDFETFRSMVTRCGKPARPVRLLLVSPDANWLGDGARRRGLGQSNFREIQIASLRRIARVREEFSGNVEVRFYTWRPVFRLLFSNHNLCWFGHYSESVSNTGTNEFIDRSNSNVVVMAPQGKALDLEFFGALEHHFDELWEQSRGMTWDFKTYIM